MSERLDEVTQYGGLPYAQGSLFGIRAFRVDPLGRLVAATRDEVWTPGENVARHGNVAPGAPVQIVKSFDVSSAASSSQAIKLAGAEGKPGVKAKVEETLTYDYRTLAGPPARKVRRWQVSWIDEDHSPATCQACGFHGFTEPDAEDYENGPDARVVGVIEGYGKLTHGTRGFRAEKAKVVALLDPSGSPREEDTRGRFARAMWWRARHPGLVLFLMLALIALTLVNGMLRRYGMIEPEVFVPVALAISGLLLANAVCATIPPRLVVRKWGPPGAEWRPGRTPAYWEPSDKTVLFHERLARQAAIERFDRVRQNYPDVKVFTSRQAMIAEYGIAPPPPPPEPTPQNTDGFWTLPVKGV